MTVNFGYGQISPDSSVVILLIMCKVKELFRGVQFFFYICRVNRYCEDNIVLLL